MNNMLDYIEHETFGAYLLGYSSISGVRSTPQYDVFEVAFDERRISLDTVTSILVNNDFRVLDNNVEHDAYGYQTMTIVLFTFKKENE